MDVGQIVDSYTFGDIVRLWSRERLVHEVLVARELARGVLDEGLRLQSVNPKHMKSSESLRRSPYIGYAGRDKKNPVLLKDTAFEHLRIVAACKVDASLDILRYEFVTKDDFRDWLVHTGRSMPVFWYADEERAIGA